MIGDDQHPALIGNTRPVFTGNLKRKIEMLQHRIVEFQSFQMPVRLDKAIDLIDEAASRLRIEIDSVPSEIDELDRKITQLEIQREALKKEKDVQAKQRLEKLSQEIANLKESSSKLKSHWQKEKLAISEIQKVKENIDATKISIEQAERIGDLGKAAELKYGTLPNLEKVTK